jgi:hypothetical protein
MDSEGLLELPGELDELTQIGQADQCCTSLQFKHWLIFVSGLKVVCDKFGF